MTVTYAVLLKKRISLAPESTSFNSKLDIPLLVLSETQLVVLLSEKSSDSLFKSTTSLTLPGSNKFQMKMKNDG